MHYENVKSVFGDNLWKYIEFTSWFNWYPDLFLDLISPEKGGIKLHPDQRVYLRAIMRFVSIYGTFPRGWSKTFCEVLAMVLVGMRYPDIDLALSAQTKENAAELLRDKYYEIIKFYPMLENEVEKTTFTKNDAEIRLKNGAKIDILANAQSSKGQRRKRMNIEESALLNNTLFDDVLKPIVEVSRYTVGNLAIVNPEELNQQINFFTTSGFRGSDEYQRSIKMLDGMENLSGEIVLGASWFLASWFGRGSTKSQILNKKRDMTYISFAQNYESKWVGSSDNALVDINKFMECRTLTNPMINLNKYDEEFYMGVDVARSQKSNNNQSSIVVGRVLRAKDSNRIRSIEIPNIVHIPNTLNFSSQACTIKKTKIAYNAKMVICDGNGIGAGLIDELLKDAYDPVTGDYLGCWNTINTTNEPESPDAESCLFDMKAQGNQSKIITDFIDTVDSGKLRLLCKKMDCDFTVKDRKDPEHNILPFIQTDLLFEETANLKLKYNNNNSLSVERVVKKMDKDRFSALSYLIYYIVEYCSFVKTEIQVPTHVLSLARKPSISSRYS